MSTLNKLMGKWRGEVPKKKNSSSVQLRTYELYFKELSEFSLDDLRFMIIQEVGIEYLIEKALGYLKEDILLEANYYEGDLLSSLLKLPSDTWNTNKKEYKELKELIENNQNKVLSELDISMDVDRELSKNITTFLELNI